MKKLFLLIPLVMMACSPSEADLKAAKNKKLQDSLKLSLDKALEDVANSLKEIETGVLPNNIDYTQTDCSYWTEEKVDKMTDKKDIRAKEKVIFGVTELPDNKYKFNSVYLSTNLFMDGSKISIQFKLEGFGSCVGDDDKINILFDDDTKMELKNSAEYNCDGVIAVWLPKKSDKIKQLMEKKIKTIRPTANDKYVDIDVSKNTATHFSMVVKCLASK